MKKIVFIIVALLIAVYASAQVPKNGDTGAKIVSNFTNVNDGMRFVVQDILFQLDLVPDVYDEDLGYIVTERFFYDKSDTWCSCQFVFIFMATPEDVVVKITGRDYENLTNSNMHFGPLEYKKGGKAEEAYWKCLIDMANKIPHKSLSYYRK